MHEVLNKLNKIIDIKQDVLGEDYLKQLLKNVAKSLNVKYAFIAHSLGSLNKVQTDIVWAEDDFVDNFTYNLRDTPCEIVMSGKRVCIHSSDVSRLFPKDELLQKMGVESYVGAPVLDRFNNIIGLLVLLDDKPMKDSDLFRFITDFLANRASTEIERNKIEENLARKVSQKTLELQDAKLEIESMNQVLTNTVNEEIKKNKYKQQIISQQSKMATMGEMIENIIHQWKQPLSVISASVTNIKINISLGTLREDELDDSLMDINDSITNLSQTINDFKNFFKETKSKANFELTNTFKNVLNLLESLLKNNNIIIINDIKDTTIFGHENELIQVLVNILNNSIDELSKKDNETKLIIINSTKDHKSIKISIKDSAGGINAEDIEKIFDYHFTTKDTGTGIGLYMSKMIVQESMNGDIFVKNSEFTYDNTSYIGAEFKIIFPLG